MVQGTADPEDTGITVNGVVALVHGSRWAAEIPIRAGHNAITAVAITESGAEGTATIAVDGSAAESVVALRAEPASGVGPLTVTWRMTNRTGRPLVSFALDHEGHGMFGEATTSLDGSQTVYPAAGLFVPVVRATDDQGNVHVARTAVQVDDAQSASARFQSLWTGFTARLLAEKMTIHHFDNSKPGLLERLSYVINISRFHRLGFKQLSPWLQKKIPGA